MPALVRLCGLIAALALAGCHSLANADLHNGPAVLEQPGPAARAELQAAVAGLLHLPSVQLTDDALLHESLLVIERNRPRDQHGVQLSGRDLDRPERFQLMRIDGQCVLVQLRTQARVALFQSRCRLTAATPP